MARSKDIEEEMLGEAKKKVAETMEEAKKKGEKILEQAEEKAQKIEAQRMEKMEVIQNRLLAREEKMDEKLEKLEEEKTKLSDKQKELEERIKEQTGKIAEVAGLSKDDAKKLLLSKVETENQKEITDFIEKLKTIKKEEADKEAAQIISKSLPRVAVDAVTEFTSKIVDLPNEDFKGKLI
jgi:ribonuclease Y